MFSVEKIQKVKIQKLQGQKNRRMKLLLKCAVCDSGKSKFLKEQEVSGLLSSLKINTLLNKISVLGPFLF